MKKLAFLLLVLITCKTNAQVEIGFKVGMNLCSHIGPDAAKGGFDLIGWSSSTFINLGLSKNTSLHLAIEQSWEGINFKYREVNHIHSIYPSDRFFYDTVIANGAFKYNYANFPILIRQKIGKAIFVETGPQFGLLLRARQIATINDFLGSRSSTQSIYYRNVRGNFGWDFGVGYKISPVFTLGVRYNLGLSKLGSKDYQHANYKSSVFSANLFVSPFRKKTLRTSMPR